MPATALCLGQTSAQGPGEGQAPGCTTPVVRVEGRCLAEFRPSAHSCIWAGSALPTRGTECLAGLQPQIGPWLQVYAAQTPNLADTEFPGALQGGPVSWHHPRGTRGLEHQHFIVYFCLISDCLHLMPGGLGQSAGWNSFPTRPGSWGGRTCPRHSPSSCSLRIHPSAQSPSQVDSEFRPPHTHS